MIAKAYNKIYLKKQSCFSICLRTLHTFKLKKTTFKNVAEADSVFSWKITTIFYKLKIKRWIEYIRFTVYLIIFDEK